MLHTLQALLNMQTSLSLHIPMWRNLQALWNKCGANRPISNFTLPIKARLRCLVAVIQTSFELQIKRYLTIGWLLLSSNVSNGQR